MLLSPAISGNDPHSGRVVSLHFPKAAGTSLGTRLTKLLGGKIAFDYNHAHSQAPARRLPTACPGHFRALRSTAAAAYWMTFLRHPVDYLISIYFFWKSVQEPTTQFTLSFFANALRYWSSRDIPLSPI
jgi:hypothetical protein